MARRGKARQGKARIFNSMTFDDDLTAGRRGEEYVYGYAEESDGTHQLEDVSDLRLDFDIVWNHTCVDVKTDSIVRTRGTVFIELLSIRSDGTTFDGWYTKKNWEQLAYVQIDGDGEPECFYMLSRSELEKAMGSRARNPRGYGGEMPLESEIRVSQTPPRGVPEWVTIGVPVPLLDLQFREYRR